MKVLSPEAMRPSSLPKTTIKSTSLNPLIHSFIHRSLIYLGPSPPDGYVRAALTRPGQARPGLAQVLGLFAFINKYWKGGRLVV